MFFPSFTWSEWKHDMDLLKSSTQWRGARGKPVNMRGSRAVWPFCHVRPPLAPHLLQCQIWILPAETMVYWSRLNHHYRVQLEWTWTFTSQWQIKLSSLSQCCTTPALPVPHLYYLYHTRTTCAQTPLLTPVVSWPKGKLSAGAETGVTTIFEEITFSLIATLPAGGDTWAKNHENDIGQHYRHFTPSAPHSGRHTTWPRS